MKPEIAVGKNAAMRPETHARHELSSSRDSLDDVLHLSRYVWAIENIMAADGSVVVDLGCGTGFGLTRLRGHFQRAVGVDFDPEVVDLNSASGTEGIEFICGDVCEDGLADRINVRNADVVVSMETIEHLEDYFSFLRNATQIMSPTGTLIIGTPNRSMTYERYPGRRHMDPSHVQEFTPISLANVLGHYFQSVELFFQFVPGYWSAAHTNRPEIMKPLGVKSAAKGWVPPEALKLARRARAGFRRTTRDARANWGRLYSLSDVSFTEVSAAPELLTEAFALVAVCRGPGAVPPVPRGRDA